MYCVIYECKLKNEVFPTDDIIALFSGDGTSDDIRTSLERMLDDTIECGFNNGFRFAMDIFSNRLENIN